MDSGVLEVLWEKFGPVGDHDFNGFVELDVFVIWAERIGTNPSDYQQYDWPYPLVSTDRLRYLPGRDVDPNNDNNDYVELVDFYQWRENIGKHYP